jgi:hypothetical protein
MTEDNKKMLQRTRLNPELLSKSMTTIEEEIEDDEETEITLEEALDSLRHPPEQEPWDKKHDHEASWKWVMGRGWVRDGEDA